MSKFKGIANIRDVIEKGFSQSTLDLGTRLSNTAFIVRDTYLTLDTLSPLHHIYSLEAVCKQTPLTI
jgi:hypothetical protein